MGSAREAQRRTGDHPDRRVCRLPPLQALPFQWAELGRKLSEKDGTKSLGKKILSVADDVTETYLEFAHSHLEEVSTYATQAGKPAVFKSREDAEKAIAVAAIVARPWYCR